MLTTVTHMSLWDQKVNLISISYNKPTIKVKDILRFLSIEKNVITWLSKGHLSSTSLLMQQMHKVWPHWRQYGYSNLKF